MLDVAVLCPGESETDTPSRMERREEPLAHFVMKDGTNDFERLVGVAHAVTMSQEELLAVNLGGFGLFVQDNTAFLFQVFVGPDVVVACEIVHLDTHVSQFGELA